jgi:hypothetical protein
VTDGAHPPPMGSPSNVYVYALTTRQNAASQASVRAVSLAILAHEQDADRNVWTVAATLAQAVIYRHLCWLITSQLLGVMKRIDDALVFWDPLSGERWSVPIAALAG